MAEKKYVILRLNDEEYGIDISDIKEVCEIKPVTKVPGTPEYIEGITSLRGDVLQVLNLKKRLGLPEGRVTDKAKKLVIANHGDKLTGLMVDDASHIATFDDESITLTSDLLNHINSEHVKGIGKYDDKIIILLKVENLI